MVFLKITQFDQSFMSLNKIETFIYSLSKGNKPVLTAGLIRHLNDIRELMLQNQHDQLEITRTYMKLVNSSL